MVYIETNKKYIRIYTKEVPMKSTYRRAFLGGMEEILELLTRELRSKNLNGKESQVASRFKDH